MFALALDFLPAINGKEEKQEMKSNRDAREIKQEGGGETHRREATLIFECGALKIVVYWKISNQGEKMGKWREVKVVAVFKFCLKGGNQFSPPIPSKLRILLVAKLIAKALVVLVTF